MQRVAVFVDAGYVYAQSAVCLTGANVNRSQLKLDESEFINQLKSLALTVSAGAQLLRIYWYDGAKNGMTVEQLILADMQDVKVRLGSINSAGEQKGVDSLLVTDLIDLARNQAISDAVIVTGDGDMRIAVQIAQSFGVRIHLVGLEPSRVSESRVLKQEADTVHQVSRTDVAKFMRHLSPPAVTDKPHVLQLAASAPAAQVGVEPPVSLDFGLAVKQSIRSILSPLGDREMADLRNVVAVSGNSLPQEYDRRILGTCCALLAGRLLDYEERRQMRKEALEFIRGTPERPMQPD